MTESLRELTSKYPMVEHVGSLRELTSKYPMVEPVGSLRELTSKYPMVEPVGSLRELTSKYPITRYLVPHVDFKLLSVTGHSRSDVVRALASDPDRKQEIYDILYDCCLYELHLVMEFDVVVDWFVDAYFEDRRSIEDFFDAASIQAQHYGGYSDKERSLALKYTRAIITPNNEQQFYTNSESYSSITEWEVLGVFATKELFKYAYDYIDEEDKLGTVLLYAYTESEQRLLDVLDIIVERYNDHVIYVAVVGLVTHQCTTDEKLLRMLIIIEKRFPGVKQKVLDSDILSVEGRGYIGRCLKILYEEDV